MRVSPKTISILLELAKKNFGEDAPVRLFGSRTNDNAKGGDIDIHVIAPNSTFQDEIQFLVDVEELLDEKVDIRVQTDCTLLIDEIAIEEGILLSGHPKSTGNL